nr:MAG TPA: hypothetical protein [Caudoviricetes sp.]
MFMVYPSFKVDIPVEACYNVLVSFGWSQETLAKLFQGTAGVSFLCCKRTCSFL